MGAGVGVQIRAVLLQRMRQRVVELHQRGTGQGASVLGRRPQGARRAGRSWRSDGDAGRRAGPSGCCGRGPVSRPAGCPALPRPTASSVSKTSGIPTVGSPGSARSSASRIRESTTGSSSRASRERCCVSAHSCTGKSARAVAAGASPVAPALGREPAQQVRAERARRARRTPLRRRSASASRCRSAGTVVNAGRASGSPRWSRAVVAPPRYLVVTRRAYHRSDQEVDERPPAAGRSSRPGRRRESPANRRARRSRRPALVPSREGRRSWS